MYWEFRGLIRFYIFIKRTSLRRFVYNGFKVHWVRINSANEKYYKN